MRVLVGNMVKTGVADYPCATREEAEALFLTLHDLREPEPPAAATGTKRSPPEKRKARR